MTMPDKIYTGAGLCTEYETAEGIELKKVKAENERLRNEIRCIRAISICNNYQDILDRIDLALNPPTTGE